MLTMRKDSGWFAVLGKKKHDSRMRCGCVWMRKVGSSLDQYSHKAYWNLLQVVALGTFCCPELLSKLFCKPIENILPSLLFQEVRI